MVTKIMLAFRGWPTGSRKGFVVVDVPVWVEPEGDTRAREDPADGVRCLDFEFVFRPSWWVPDRDQEFVVG